MGIGTPAQTVRLLPSLYSNLISPVLTSGCPAQIANNCSELRGSLFDPTKSSTWKKTGQVNGEVKGSLLYTPQSSYGFDVVGQDGSLPKVDKQLVQAYERNVSSLGTFGLNDTNINGTGNPPSLLQSLKDDQNIPSLSWAYTAGASYLEPPLLGSLTLGGYDETRFNVTGDYYITNPGNDGQRNLLVDLMQISTNISNASALLTSEISVYLDTTVPQLILPTVVCIAFEKTFNLSWDSSHQKYAVNDNLHERLLALNPTIVLSLWAVVSTNTSQKTLDITMPYSSFDLEDKVSDGTGNARYFPLQRAETPDQYTLGRAFFQNAYVIVDYERASVKVYQALYPSSDMNERLVAIDPLNPAARQSPSPTGRHFDRRYLALIVIGPILVVCVPLFPWYFFCWRRRQKRRDQKESEEKIVKGYEDPEQRRVRFESVHKEAINLELSGDEIIHALDSPKDEMGSNDTQFRELPAQVPVSEMQASSPTIELEGSLVHPMMRPIKRKS